jgi:hypothetical protein
MSEQRILEQPTQFPIQTTPATQPQSIYQIAIAVLLVALFASSIAAYHYYREAMMMRAMTNAYLEEFDAVESSQAEQVLPVTDVDQGAPASDKNFVYELEVSSEKNAENDHMALFSIVSNLLGIKTLSTTYALYYDTNHWEPGPPSKLFLRTENKLEQTAQQSENGFTVSVFSEREDLLPYLQDRKYCVKDADCTDRTNFCALGAYNQYAQYAIYGCAAYSSIEGFSNDDIQKLDCSMNEMTGQSDVDASFTTAKCIQNVCTAVDMKVSCR